MAKFFTVKMSEAESVVEYTDQGPKHSYAGANVTVLNRSPNRARKIAHRLLTIKMDKARDAAGWEGGGGTPIFYSFELYAPNGKLLVSR